MKRLQPCLIAALVPQGRTWDIILTCSHRLQLVFMKITQEEKKPVRC